MWLLGDCFGVVQPPTEAAARSASADVPSEGGGDELRARLEDSRAQSAGCPAGQAAAAAAARPSFEVRVSSASKVRSVSFMAESVELVQR